MLRQIILCGAVALSLTACIFEDKAINQTNDYIESLVAQKQLDKTKANWRTTLKRPPMLTFSENAEYIWKLETNLGEMQLKLFHQTAPMHVSSTIFLTKLGFYDGLTFHRIIPNFMAQGGDPLGNGQGSPGYRYAGEFEPLVKHDKKGLLSMANAGPNTDGSQFFITFKATPWLNGKHTVFGEIIKGDDVLEKIEASAASKEKQHVVINRATISVL
jgi:peptidyl-prolyl cis-trans isomerase B (cyclophilin B)